MAVPFAGAVGLIRGEIRLRRAENLTSSRTARVSDTSTRLHGLGRYERSPSRRRDLGSARITGGE
jgi:hypothetical protein